MCLGTTCLWGNWIGMENKANIFTAFTIMLLLLTAIAPKAMAVAFPLVSLILFLWHCSADDIKRHRNVPLATIGMFLFCALSILWSQSPDESTERVLKLSGVFFGGALFSVWIKKAYLDEGMMLCSKQLKMIAGALILTSVYFIFELLMGAQIYHLTHPDAINDPQGFTKSVFNRGIIIVALSTIPITTLLLRQKEKLWGCFLAISVLSAMFISESQTIQLGVIFFFIVLSTYKITKRDLRKVVYVVLPIGFLSMPFLFPYIFEQKPEFLLSFLEQAYPMQRLELWSNVSLAIQEKLFFGYGIDTISTHKFNMGSEYFKDAYTPHPHNAFLQIWYEFGLFGVLTTTALILCPFMRFKGCQFRTRSWAYSFYISILFIAFVSYGLWQSWWIGTLFFLLGLGRLTIYQMEHKACLPESQKTPPSV